MVSLLRSKHPVEIIQERLLAKCIPEPNSGCWLWIGALAGSPKYPDHWYGLYNDGEKSTTAHRASYKAFVGPVPEGLEIGHTCHVKICINPDHLKLMTHKENMEDTKRTRATHCKHGHPLTSDNLYKRPDGLNKRDCITCRRMSTAKANSKRRMERLECLSSS